MGGLEDKVLILRFKGGSRAALCRIYEKYRTDLLKLAALLLNDRGDAEDAVHDVFVAFTNRRTDWASAAASRVTC